MIDENHSFPSRSASKLEKTSIVVDIIYKGLVASLIAGATLYVTLNKSSLENYQGCKEIEQYLLRFVTENEKNSVTEKLVDSRLAAIPSACQPIDQVFVQHLLNSWKSIKVTETAAANTPQAGSTNAIKQALHGWVPFGKKINGQFNDRNFDVINETDQFIPGEIWRARWPVSVRQAEMFSLLDGFSQKQVVGQLLPGQCWKAASFREGNQLYWSNGETVSCPK